MDTRPTSSDHGPVDGLAEEFLARHRRGECPAIDEYVERHPEWADEIREVFPALVMMEQFKPAPGELTGSHPAEPAGPGRPPERLGEYRILREVGRGGMGVVYEAVQEPLGRHVALKVLPWQSRLDAAQLGRFRLEATSAARLHHTNIVPVFGVGEHEGVHYYSMQFIHGTGLDVVLRDLRRLRDEGPPAAVASSRVEDLTVSVALAHGLLDAPVPCVADGSAEASTEAVPGSDLGVAVGSAEVPAAPPSSPDRSGLSDPSHAHYYRSVARIGVQVAEALAYAHDHGVLHRDIKPSNLLLDAEGQTWVTDFGLAKLEGSDGPTRTGDIVGTLRYMAPERFDGRSDPRSDVYGLGVTLYELLTMRPAFDESDRPHLIHRIAHDPPPPLRRVDKGIPRDLEVIVLKCLAKAPDDRYATAAELRDELNRVVQNRPTRTRPLSPPERFWRWCRRNPLVAGLNALAASLTIVIAVVSAAAAVRLNSQQAETAKNLFRANKNLIQAHTSEAEARRHSRRVGQRFEALGAVERAVRLARSVGITESDRLRLRNEAIAAMALPDLRVAREVDVPRAKENGFAVDPAFEQYAFKREDGTVIVRRLADDSDLFRLAGLPPRENTHAGYNPDALHSDNTQASFSPDGRYLAMTAGRSDILQLWDLREPRLVLTDRELTWSNAINWSFHPDGRELALGHRDGSIVFYELPSGRLLRRRTQDPASAWTLAYSPDGSRLAVPAKDGRRVQVISRGDDRLLAVLTHGAAAEYLVWNPRRPNELAAACADRVIYVWDVEAGQQVVQLKGETSDGIILAYHPGGELLASRGWPNVLRLWDTRTGRQLLSRPSTWSSTLEFDRTGRLLSVDATQEKVRFLELADAAECRTLVRKPFRGNDRHGPLAIDPTGRRAVTGGSALTVWDLPTGETLATLPGISAPRTVLFDASGAVVTTHPSLLRWPVAGATDGAATIGPPQLLQRPGTIGSLAITPDGRTIAAAMFKDGGIVFETQDPQHARWLRPQRDVRYIAISPDGRRVVTGSHSYPGGMKLWDAQTGRLVLDFPDVPRELNAVRSFSPDGRWLAVNWDGWVLFDTTTWTPRVRLFRGASSWLAFAPDSRTAAYDNNAETVFLVDVETGRERARLDDPDQSRLEAMAFTPDGSRLVVTLREQPYLRAWDLRAIRRRLAELGLDWDSTATSDTPAPDRSLPAIPKPFRVQAGNLSGLGRRNPYLILDHGEGSLWTVAYSPDGRTLATAGRDDGSVTLWDPSDGLARTILKGHTDRVRTVAYSPDGRTLATGSRDGSLRFWEAETGREILHVKGVVQNVRDLAFSPDGRTFAIGEDRQPGEMKLWDAATGEARSTLARVPGRILSVAFSPDGRVLAAACGDGAIRAWDVTSGREAARIGGDAAGSEVIRFTPDGGTLISGHLDGSVNLWNAGTWAERVRLLGHGDVRSLAVSPDGGTLAVGTHAGVVKLWDLRARREESWFQAHRSGIWGLAFSPDGRTLATAGVDWDSKLWDIPPRQGPKKSK